MALPGSYNSSDAELFIPWGLLAMAPPQVSGWYVGCVIAVSLTLTFLGTPVREDGIQQWQKAGVHEFGGSACWGWCKDTTLHGWEPVGCDSSQCVFIVIKTGSSSELLLLGTQQATEPFCIYLALSVKRKCQYIHVPWVVRIKSIKWHNVFYLFPVMY